MEQQEAGKHMELQRLASTCEDAAEELVTMISSIRRQDSWGPSTSRKPAPAPDHIDALLAGHSYDTVVLPTPTTNQLRIYVCSTYKDFNLERQRLWDNVLPDLQHYFLSRGLDIELVDLHLGQCVDPTYDHDCMERIVDEIEMCQKLSVGAFFLCFLGNKLGPTALPAHLEEVEYTHMHGEAFEAGKDVKLLEQWYIKDSNAIPPVYVLQNPQTKYKHFTTGYCEGEPDDIEDWLSDHKRLQDLIQHSAKVCHAEGRINQVHDYKQQRFFLSTLEQEIETALEIGAPQSMMVVTRVMEGLVVSDAAAGTYTDLKNKEADRTAQAKLKQLKELLASKLNDDNRLTLYVPWSDTGLDPSLYSKHAQYLDDLQVALVTRITAMAENALKKKSTKPDIQKCDERSQLYHEVVAHFQHARQLSSAPGIIALKDTDEKVLTGMKNPEPKDGRQVLLLGWPDGVGKSTTVARLCDLSRNTLGKDTLLIVRFIRVTSTSSTLHQVLTSICSQLCWLLHLDYNLGTYTISQMIECFHHLLAAVGDKQLVILIDGLEQLQKTNPNLSQLLVDWLGEKLPKSVHIVATYTPPSLSSADIFQPLKGKIKSKNNHVSVPKLTETDAKSIITMRLNHAKRKLQPEQEKHILHAFKFDVNLLFLHLFIDSALTWPSSKSVQNMNKLKSLDTFIQHCFDTMERLHGAEIVAMVCRYLNSSWHGLSEAELLDVLSCNNAALQLTLPSFHLLRFPPVVWSKLRRRGLGNFLCAPPRHCDHKLLYMWRHAVLRQVSALRYRVRVEDIKQSHQDLADYFLGTWVANKPLVAPTRAIHILDTGCRFISPQPLLYSDTMYNLRRLNELWYHLLQAGDVDHFKEHCFCDFEYLLAKMHATSVHDLIVDLEMTSRHVLDPELYLILMCLTKAMEVLCRDPLQLANELIGRLRPIKEIYPDHMENLVQQCMEWCDSFSFPILVPLSSWLPDPRQDLVTRFDCPEGVTALCATVSAQHLFTATPKSEIKMYHVASKKLIRTLLGHKAPVTCLLMMHDNQTLVSTAMDGTLRLWEVATGRLLHTYKGHSDGVLCCILTKDNVAITGSKDKSIGMMSLDTGKLQRTGRQHEGSVTCLAINSYSTILMSGSVDKKVYQWYMEDMSVINCIDVSAPVTCMALSLDNTFLLVGTEDKTMQVYAFTTGSLIHVLQQLNTKAEKVVIAEDCHLCCVACSDGKVYIYNLRSTELLHVLPASAKNPVLALCLAKKQHFMFTASKDEIAVWTLFKQVSITVEQDDAHSDIVTCMAISRDGKTAITGSRDSVVKLWNMEISDFAENLVGHYAQVTCVALAEEEAFAVSGSEDTTIKVWSIIMGCVITDYRGHRSTITSLYVLHKGFRILSGEEDGVINIWSAEDGHGLLCIEGPTRMLHVAPNDHLAISGDADQILKIWSVDEGSVVGQKINHADRISCLVFSPDSQYLITGSADCSLKVWEAATGKLTQVLVEHDQEVSCAAVSEGNRHILSGSHDHRLLVWGLSTGAVEHHLLGHTDIVTTVKITQDASIAVSGSKDNTLRVWNIIYGLPVTLFDMHMPVLECLINWDASRLMVMLHRSRQVPRMCLHNSPAGEIKSQSMIDIHVQGDNPVLPIRPKPVQVYRAPNVYPHPKSAGRTFSVSTIPEIIKVSPIKAPLQTMVKKQAQHKEIRTKICKESSSVGSTNTMRTRNRKDLKSSKFCTVL